MSNALRTEKHQEIVRMGYIFKQLARYNHTHLVFRHFKSPDGALPTQRRLKITVLAF
jgi:hypothetical protein